MKTKIPELRRARRLSQEELEKHHAFLADTWL